MSPRNLTVVSWTELNWTAISSAIVTFVRDFCFSWLYRHLVNKVDWDQVSSKFLIPFSLLDVFLSIYLFHFISFHFIWLWVARQTAMITYLELSRALVGLWLPSHCEEALIALFGMRPVSIPSAWKHIRNMASSSKKETHVLRICNPKIIYLTHWFYLRLCWRPSLKSLQEKYENLSNLVKTHRAARTQEGGTSIWTWTAKTECCFSSTSGDFQTINAKH